MTEGDAIVPVWVGPDEEPPHDVPHPIATFTEELSLENEPGARPSTSKP